VCHTVSLNPIEQPSQSTRPERFPRIMSDGISGHVWVRMKNCGTLQC
jgi:hypothetical protein